MKKHSVSYSSPNCCIGAMAAAILHLRKVRKKPTSQSSSKTESAKKSTAETKYQWQSSYDAVRRLIRSLKGTGRSSPTTFRHDRSLDRRRSWKTRSPVCSIPNNDVTDKYKADIATIPQVGDKKTVSQKLCYPIGQMLFLWNMMFSRVSGDSQCLEWKQNPCLYTENLSIPSKT